jgi:FtsP/CotA-like multicopper oxidase with cupredoxin domain
MPTAQRPLAVATAVLCFFLCNSLLLLGAEAKVRHYEWDISYQHKSADCFKKLAVTVNGENPGPTIHATQGDTVVVTVHNHREHRHPLARHPSGIDQSDMEVLSPNVGKYFLNYVYAC